MGKKKRTQVFVLKPWCWYCEREFEDEKVLLQHQKSKHFKCTMCPRKLNTAGGLMVHSQQVHKCEPEPLTNTLPGRDGYDIEIFGMEGVPANAQAEWKARKEAEFGTAALAAVAAAKRPRISYNVIPEADLMAALAQHKILMASRNKKGGPGALPPGMPPMSMPPNGAPMPFPMSLPPGMPPPTLPVQGMPGFPPPPGFMPPFPATRPPVFNPSASPLPPGATPPGAAGFASPSPAPPIRPPPSFVAESKPSLGVSPAPASATSGAKVQPPKDGVMWPDAEASPVEKRALQSRYRYTSPSPDGEGVAGGLKRKAAADFI